MNSKMNITELTKNQEIIRIYKNEEELNFSKIKEVLENINYNYDTKNTHNLENIQNELINKLNTINNIHQNNIVIIEKNISKYRKAKIETENIFNNLIK